MARKAVFHLRYRNHTTADPAYARKPTAAELQKGIHNLVQVLSIVKMFIFFFSLWTLRKGLLLADLSSIYYLGQKLL